MKEVKAMSDILKEIGNYFKMRRIMCSITIDEMADYCKVSPNTIRNFEKGDSNNLLVFLYYKDLFGFDWAVIKE